MSKNTSGNRVLIQRVSEDDTASDSENSKDSESSGVSTGEIFTFVGIGLASASAL